MGLVKHVFTSDTISKLKGYIGIGHTRYSTSAKSEHVNCQPFVVHSMHGSLAVAHNGELVNAESLRKQVFCVYLHVTSMFIYSNNSNRHCLSILFIYLVQR